MALLAAPLALVPVPGVELAVTVAVDAASAAAVEGEAAMAAAAIARGAFGLLAAAAVAAAVAGVSAGVTLTAIKVAITFGVATGAPSCCGAVVGSAEFAEPLSADVLSVDLPPEGVEVDLPLVDGAALGLPLALAESALESSGCAALSPALFEFEGCGA